MPISIKPVEKAPIRKYLREASLLFRFFLSLPVNMYNGMDMISMPRNSISKVLKEDAMLTPHRIKNINEKYSATLIPTLLKSRHERIKYNKVLPNAMLL